MTKTDINDFSCLSDHQIFHELRNELDLRIFMEIHVFAVWDFMSLIKSLQATFTPTSHPWSPPKYSNVARFINELVLEEESDSTALDGQFSSHFEVYQKAMNEVGADTTGINEFVKISQCSGVEKALSSCDVPQAAKKFTSTTFSFIDLSKPHKMAAALAVGREQPIPQMFRTALKNIGITDKDAPTFHYYLKRHIHLDQDFHGPMSSHMVKILCEDDEVKHKEVEEVSEKATKARLALWDGIVHAIYENRKRCSYP